MAIQERLQGRPQETAETLLTPYATFGIYKPHDVLTNADIERWQVTTDSGKLITADYLSEKLGIERRHIARPDETAIDMGVAAAKAAIEDPTSVDAVFVSTSYPLGVNVSAEISERLGMNPSFHMDIHAACSGFARGFAYIKEHEEEFEGKRIVFVTSEKYSDTVVDLRTKGAATNRSLDQTIFGDGGVAINFRYGEDLRILASNRMKLPQETNRYICMPIDPAKMVAPYIEEYVPESESGTFEQDGRNVYKSIKKFVPDFNNHVVEQAGLVPSDITLVIPHQGSGPILEGLQDVMHGYTIYKDMEEGNLSSASIPKAWARAQREGRIHRDDKLLLSGFGAGLYAASVVVQIG